MRIHRHPLLTVATFTFIISTLPVNADHHQQVSKNLEDKHNWKVIAEKQKTCTHKQNNQKIAPNTSLVRLTIGEGNYTFSTESPSVHQ